MMRLRPGRGLAQNMSAVVSALLTERQWNGDELARTIGRSSNYMAKRLRGDEAFDLDDVDAIATAFSVPTARLTSDVWVSPQTLDQLPLNTVIIDEGGLARQAHFSSNGENFWAEAGDGDIELSSTELLTHLRNCGVPGYVTVLWGPKDDTVTAQARANAATAIQR